MMKVQERVATVLMVFGLVGGFATPSMAQEKEELPPGLENWPAGTCANDPTLEQCPHFDAIVTEDGRVQTADGWMTIPEATEEGVLPESSVGPIAAAASLADPTETEYGLFEDQGRQLYGCAVRTSHVVQIEGPRKARGIGWNECIAGQGVTWIEVLETIGVYRESTTNWVQRAEAYDESVSDLNIRATAYDRCKNNNYNWWGAKAYASSIRRGALYTGTNPPGPTNLREGAIHCGGA